MVSPNVPKRIRRVVSVMVKTSVLSTESNQSQSV